MKTAALAKSLYLKVPTVKALRIHHTTHVTHNRTSQIKITSPKNGRGLIFHCYQTYAVLNIKSTALSSCARFPQLTTRVQYAL
jgi:hypothetical protein